MSLAAEIIPFDPDQAHHFGEYVPKEALAAYTKAGPCVTIKIGDIYAVAIGLVKQSQHTAEAWMLVNEEARYKHAKTIIRAVRKQLDIHEISEDLHRVQITIEFSKASFVKWSQRLGFEMEGLMRAYDDMKRDYFLMARVRDGRHG